MASMNPDTQIGCHSGQEYIKSDRTIEKYAISFNCERHPFEFLLKNPSVELALLPIFDIWPPPIL